ncbi:MAG: GAF domain-containing protein [Pseudomonadota bacterium]
MADAGALDLSDLHERLLHVMREDLGLDACCVTLLTDDGNNLHHTVLFAARASDDDPADSSLKGAVGELDMLYTARDPATFASQVIATGAPLVIDDMHKLTNGGHCPLMAAEGFCAYLGAPITLGSGALGAAEALSRAPRTWSLEDKRKMLSYARILSALLEDRMTVQPAAQDAPGTG